MWRTKEHLDPRRRAAVDRRLRGGLAHLRPRGHRSPLRGGRHLRLPPLRRGRGGGAGPRATVPWWSRAARGVPGDYELHERRVLLEPVDVALRRREPMCRVRGVVHGPAAGLSASKKGGRPGSEATLDRAATLRNSFLFLITGVRGRGVL